LSAEGTQARTEISSSTRGRPRDAAIEVKVLRTAFELYAERGWTGFSYREIAKRSGVGKAALYLRWPEKTSLLIASLEAAQRPIADIDTGSIREDLIELAEVMYGLVTSPHGGAFLRLQVEGRNVPELSAALEARSSIRSVMNVRRIVRRAVSRGELPAETSPTLLADLVVGAVVNHVLATPRRLSEEVRDRARDYIGAVVDAALLGAAAAARLPVSDLFDDEPIG
jgi:AcrR family transcriptional regulator